MKERDGKNEELVIIKKTSEKHMWLTDLDNFEKSLEKYVLSFCFVFVVLFSEFISIV